MDEITTENIDVFLNPMNNHKDSLNYCSDGTYEVRWGAKEAMWFKTLDSALDEWFKTIFANVLNGNLMNPDPDFDVDTAKIKLYYRMDKAKSLDSIVRDIKKKMGSKWVSQIMLMKKSVYTYIESLAFDAMNGDYDKYSEPCEYTELLDKVYCQITK